MIINEKNIYLLHLYKSIFFRFCKFKTDSNNKQYKIIVNALNIKNRKQRITYIYDSTCNYIDDYYQKENICGFKNNQCYVQQKKHSDLQYGCCRKCKYKRNTGCPTKNIACKLFNCSEVKCTKKVLKYEDIITLKLLSIRQRIIIKSDFFSTREEVLKDLYSYSIIYSTIRILIRLYKNR